VAVGRGEEEKMKPKDKIVFLRGYDDDDLPFSIPKGCEGEVLDDPYDVDDAYQVTICIDVGVDDPEIEDGLWDVTVPRKILEVIE
jgi:hypothetical protein